MKKNLLTLIIISFSVYAGRAQVSLPYYSGFDTPGQQAGWTEFKTAATTFSHWGLASFNAYSAPNCISHDYSPSSGITLTDNWYVSPAFSIPNGGVLDSIRYMFSGFSVPLAGDTIGLYLMQGSGDPALASQRILLFDFRGSDYPADATWHAKTQLSLPAYSGNSFLAIRYRNSDCSSNWLSVHFDNIAINGNPVGLEDQQSSQALSIHPNPGTGEFHISGEGVIYRIRVYDLSGKVVFENENMPGHRTVNLQHLEEGSYIVSIESDHGPSSLNLIISR